jgi:hypothetical protein
MRERLHLPRVGVAIAMLGLALGAVGCVGGQDDGCPGVAVYHLPAGTCVNPSALEVTGVRVHVEAAISSYDGSILYTTSGSHHVRFPGDDLATLDRIKDEMTEAGFEVRYSTVLELP